MLPAPFNPAQQAALLAAFADPSLSFTTLAACHGASAQDLSLFLSRPEIQDLLDLRASAITQRLRLIAADHLSGAIAAASKVLADFTQSAPAKPNKSAPPTPAPQTPAPNPDLRAQRTALYAAGLIYRIARFTHPRQSRAPILHPEGMNVHSRGLSEAVPSETPGNAAPHSAPRSGARTCGDTGLERTTTAPPLIPAPLLPADPDAPSPHRESTPPRPAAANSKPAPRAQSTPSPAPHKTAPTAPSPPPSRSDPAPDPSALARIREHRLIEAKAVLAQRDPLSLDLTHLSSLTHISPITGPARRPGLLAAAAGTPSGP